MKSKHPEPGFSYHSPIKGMGLFGEMAESRARARNIQGDPGTS